MMVFVRVIFPIIGLVSLQSLPCKGEEEHSSKELTPMVVVETRTPRPLSEISPWVTSFSAEELQRRQVNTVGDALRLVPGMVVVRSGQAGAQASLFSRGSQSDHVSFLLDGRKLNGGFSGLYNLGQLNLGGLSGIEVLRGSSSTLYGAEGIGGTVMLRSKRPNVDGVSSNVTLSGGSFATFSGNIETNFRESDWSGNVALFGTTTDNERPNAGYWNHSGSFMLERTLSKEWSIDFLGMGHQSELGLPNANFSPSLKDYQDSENFLLSPGLIGRGDYWRSWSFYSFSRDDLESFSNSPWGDWQTHSLTTQEEVETQLDLDFDETWSMSLGSSFSTQRFEQSGNFSFRESWEKVSGFGLLRYFSGSGFELSGGLRVEDYSDFGNPTTWSVFSRQSLSDAGTLFGRYSTSFAPPTANDLYYPTSGNLNLQPEEGDSWEVGLALGTNKSTGRTRVTFFNNRIDDLIEFGFPNVNIGRTKARGIELSLEWDLPGSYRFYGVYAYLDACNLTSGEDFLDRRPKHSGSMGLEYFGANTVVGSEMKFRRQMKEKDWHLVSPTYGSWLNADDFIVVRFYAKHDWNEGLSFFGRVENLLDTEYEEVDGYPALGLGVFGGLRYSF